MNSEPDYILLFKQVMQAKSDYERGAINALEYYGIRQAIRAELHPRRNSDAYLPVILS